MWMYITSGKNPLTVLSGVEMWLPRGLAGRYRKALAITDPSGFFALHLNGQNASFNLQTVHHKANTFPYFCHQPYSLHPTKADTHIWLIVMLHLRVLDSPLRNTKFSLKESKHSYLKTNCKWSSELCKKKNLQIQTELNVSKQGNHMSH